MVLPLSAPCWCEARNACLIGGPSGTVLPPCDQIVERVNVWCKAEDDPSDGAPKNNSVRRRSGQRARIIGITQAVLGSGIENLAGRQNGWQRKKQWASANLASPE